MGSFGSSNENKDNYVIEFSRYRTIQNYILDDDEKDKLVKTSKLWFIWASLRMFKEAIDNKLLGASVKVSGFKSKVSTFSQAMSLIKKIFDDKVFEEDNPQSQLVFLDEGKKSKLKEPKMIGDAFRALIGEVDLDGKPTGERPVDDLGILVHHEEDNVRKGRWEKERKDRKIRAEEPPERLKWIEKLEYGSLIVNMYPESIEFNGTDLLEESISEFYRAFNESEPNNKLTVPDQSSAKTTLKGSNSVDIVMLKRELTIRGWNVNIQVNKFKNPSLPADFFIDKSDFPLTRLHEDTCFVEIGEFGVVMIKFYGSKRPKIKKLLEEMFVEPAYYFMLRADGGMVFGDLRVDLDEQLSPLIEKLKGIGLKVTFVNTHWHFKKDEWEWWRFPEVDMDREIYEVPEDPLGPQTDEEREKEIENKKALDEKRGIKPDKNNKERGWI